MSLFVALLLLFWIIDCITLFQRLGELYLSFLLAGRFIVIAVFNFFLVCGFSLFHALLLFFFSAKLLALLHRTLVPGLCLFETIA
jgi:hypothetical protein